MARRKNSAKDALPQRLDQSPKFKEDVYSAEYAGYLVCDLTAAHEKELESYRPTAAEILTWQQEMCDSGFKVVGVYSKDGASVRAEIHDMDRESDMAGWRLSAFADNYPDATVVLMFKYTRILGGDLSIAQTERPKRRFG